ncbi:hypothetical protein JTB14_003931 [Gonioctena quinquepunctata]|nr:hypothetical protein JTB14_003931 [Gonioctena quinquepunctata]
MSDIITLSSSDDESSTPSPKKRIKPSFLGLSPHVTITRVTKKTKQIKKMGNPIEIHELLSDDEIENLTYQKTILQSQTIDDDDVEVTEYDNKITEDDVKITEDDDVKKLK